MQEFLSVKVNGVGNAWPVKIGQTHKFYSSKNPYDLSNASFSIVSSKSKNLQKDNINWEILIDAGHGTIQYLISSYNRIPDAIVITHPHIDHILGIDWLIQSYFREHKAPYPVYATYLCWKQTLTVFPHLKEMVKFNELIPGMEIKIEEAAKLNLIPFPVFHGNSAPGSSMLFFEFNITEEEKIKIAFTGDVLVPLLRNKDIAYLQNLDHLFVDSNNRFPYPKCNHWSITGNLPKQYNGENFLVKELKLNQLSYLISAHLKTGLDYKTYLYFDAFINDFKESELVSYNVLDFVKSINVKNIFLVHYSGSEDVKYYDENVLNKDNLKNWIIEEALRQNISSAFFVPGSGDIFPINFD